MRFNDVKSTSWVTFKSLIASKIMDFERDEGCLDEHGIFSIK